MNPYDNQLTLEAVSKIAHLNTIDDCKCYIKVMLDFYCDIIKSPNGSKTTSYIENDSNLWLQTVFSKCCLFFVLLSGIDYKKGDFCFNPIVDFLILFTFARNIIMYPHHKQEEQVNFFRGTQFYVTGVVKIEGCASQILSEIVGWRKKI